MNISPSVTGPRTSNKGIRQRKDNFQLMLYRKMTASEKSVDCKDFKPGVCYIIFLLFYRIINSLSVLIWFVFSMSLFDDKKQGDKLYNKQRNILLS